MWFGAQARNGCYKVGRGWQLSVRSVRPGTLQAVSPRIAERKWNTLYPRSPAGQLWQGCPSITEYQHLFSPPHSPFLLLSSSRSLQYVCVCSARSMQRRKIERRVGAGWQVPTIGCHGAQRISRGVYTLVIVWIYLLTYTKDLFAFIQRNDRLYVLLIALRALSITLDIYPLPSSISLSVNLIYLMILNFMFYVSTLANKVN